MLFTFFKYLFSFQRYSFLKYANWPSDDVIIILNQIFFKYDEKRYLSQFVSEMFDSLQQNSTKCAS